MHHRVCEHNQTVAGLMMFVLICMGGTYPQPTAAHERGYVPTLHTGTDKFQAQWGYRYGVAQTTPYRCPDPTSQICPAEIKSG